MRYGSVCSGIEAASVAWHPLGWEAAWLSEIEPFPSAVLAHHYPTVPNRGDMTRFQEWPDDAIDLLVGGTPCQSFSVAGLRAGLADPRGNLLLTYLAIAARYRPRWLVWENVPGVLSSGDGRDFGSLLGGLAELGYGFAYRVLDAQYCRAHGFEWAVPQRRRRVFVVGYLGDWRRAAAVLFDGASLRGDSAPRRSSRQDVAPTISSRPTGGGGLGTDFDLDGGLITDDIARCVTAGYSQRIDAETENFVAHHAAPAITSNQYGNHEGREGLVVAHALRGEGFDNGDAHSGYRDEKGLVTEPMVLMERGRNGSPNLEYRQDGTANAILTPNGGRGGFGVGAITYPINTQIATRHEALGEGTGFGVGEPDDPAFTLQAGHSHAVATGWAVRRLTPTECERLQGFPDGYTAIPFRKKPAADGPRYKALGNSMAVNVMRVLGSRIAKVEAA